MKAPDATVEQVRGDHLLRFERRLDADVPRVWSALTEPDELAGWLAAAAIDLSVGGEVMLHWLDTDSSGSDGGDAILHGVVTELAATKLIAYETDLHGLLRWELADDGHGCVLTLVNRNPAPADRLISVVVGWHVHLDHLEDALAGSPVDWAQWSPRTRAVGSGLSWQDHEQRYRSRLAR